MEVNVDISPFSWLEEPASQALYSLYSGAAKGIASLDTFNTYKKSHFNYTREVAGKVKVMGMSSAIPITEIYYPTTISTSIKRRLYSPDWVSITSKEHGNIRNRKNKTQAIDAAAYIDKNKRTVILGGPGAGKTTFLKFIAIAYSEKEVFAKTKLETSRLPFFIPLPELAKSELSLIEFMSRTLTQREGENAKAFIERSAKRGLCAVLLDSLDEVREESRSEVLRKIIEFSETYESNHIVVSCRAADYKDVLNNFNEIEITKLSNVAIQKITRSWFKSEREIGERLLRVISSDSNIRELTETPLLLSLLCIQFKHDLSLPRRKVEVYKRCIEALLRDWDATRGFRRSTDFETVSDMHKERLFEHVAGNLSSQDLNYEWKDDSVYETAHNYLSRLDLNKSQSIAVINEIERNHGILERYSVETFCFSHASIQDYFIAKNAITQRREMDLIKNNLGDERWSSVIEFICAIHHDPSGLIDLMASKTAITNLKNYPAIEKRAKLLHLMYRCLSVGPTISVSENKKANKHIVESVKNFAIALGSTGIYPLCAIGHEGIRHPYFYMVKRRPSLHEALLPYRKLTNEILEKPSQHYSEAAMSASDEIINKGNLELKDVSLILNCLIPISLSNRISVLDALNRTKINLAPGYAHLAAIINESADYIELKITSNQQQPSPS